MPAAGDRRLAEGEAVDMAGDGGAGGRIFLWLSCGHDGCAPRSVVGLV